MSQNLRQRKALAVILHPALTAAQAEQVCRDVGARITQDGRGRMRLDPAPYKCTRCNAPLWQPIGHCDWCAGPAFEPCAECRSPICSEMQFCARPKTEPEAA